jgi:hypothetical protein
MDLSRFIELGRRRRRLHRHGWGKGFEIFICLVRENEPGATRDPLVFIPNVLLLCMCIPRLAEERLLSGLHSLGGYCASDF